MGLFALVIPGKPLSSSPHSALGVQLSTAQDQQTNKRESPWFGWTRADMSRSRENTVLRAQLDPGLVSVIPNALIAEQFKPDLSGHDPNLSES